MKEVLSKVLTTISTTKDILNKRNIESEEKTGIGNIVTRTDKDLEAFIKTKLHSDFPDAQIISEESAEETKISHSDGLKFIVDPLDGTTNFTNGWPHSIAIGIINDNELTGGVIYDVLDKKVYCGIKGGGVYCCDIDNILDLKPVIPPKHETDQIAKAVISFDTPYSLEAYARTKEIHDKLYKAGASLKTIGPISLDVLKTALGKENRPNDYNNAVWHEEVRAWDLAAATAILRELGGEIIGRDGKPLSTETLSSPTAKISFIASGNPRMIENIYNIRKNLKKDIESR